jgi:chromosome partitioning protein
MHVLTVSNLKGGAGKTTAATNLAVVLAATGRRVLLVDLDSQGNSTTSMGVRLGSDEPSITELLSGAALFPKGSVTLGPNAALIPAASDLRPFVERTEDEQLHSALLNVLEDADAQEWDIAVLDTRPEAGNLTTAALRLADVVLSPVNAQDGHSVTNAGDLVTLLQQLENDVPVRFFISRATPPRKGWKRRKAHGAIEDAALERFGDAVLPTSVPEDALFHATTVGAPPVTVSAPDSLAAAAYRDLAGHLLPFLTQSA